MISCILFFSILIYIYKTEGFVINQKDITFDTVYIISTKELKEIQENKSESNYDLVEFSYSDYVLPYDKKTNTFYFSNENDITIMSSKEISIAKLYDYDHYELIAYNKNTYKKYKVVITELPIVNIETKKIFHEGKANEYKNVITTIFDNVSKNEELIVTYTLSKFKIRGVTSRVYEKKNYSIEFLDGQAKNLLGLSSNTKFALNSLYEDDSKIRDALSWKLWSEIGAYHNQYDSYNSLEYKYVELFIDNEYWGLYGIQEVANEYSMDVDKGSLFKVIDWGIPSIETLDDNAQTWEFNELVYSSLPKSDAWAKYSEFMQIIKSDELTFSTKIQNYIDFDNCIDYVIFTEVTQALDNIWKNVLFTIKDDNNTFLITPWDLDITFGTYWSGIKPYLVYNSTDHIETLIYPDEYSYPYLMSRLWYNDFDDFRKKVAQRYFELREDALSTEKLLAQSKDLYDYLTTSGARERDSIRWPKSAISKDNRVIEVYIKERLVFLDNHYASYLK